MKFLPFLTVAAFGLGAEPKAYPAIYWNELYNIWLIVTVLIFLVVVIPMLIFLVKYRYKKGEREEGVYIEGHTGLEIVWIVIPTIIVLYLATLSFAVFQQQRNVPKDAMEIKVTGYTWAWEFEYPNGKKTINELYVPAGKPIKALLTSRDVIHSFYVHPAKITEDALPGRITYLWFRVDDPGEYYTFCREYCGTAHAYMQAKLKVVSQEEFNNWYSEGVDLSSVKKEVM